MSGALRQHRFRERKKIRDAEQALIDAKEVEEKAAYDKAQEKRIEQLSKEVDRWILIALQIGDQYTTMIPEMVVGEFLGVGIDVWRKAVAHHGTNLFNAKLTDSVQFCRKESGIDGDKNND